MNTGDLAWVLISAALVWLMTPGLALFYGGLGERRNLLHTMFVPILIIGIATMVWFTVGYSLALVVQAISLVTLSTCSCQGYPLPIQQNL